MNRIAGGAELASISSGRNLEEQQPRSPRISGNSLIVENTPTVPEEKKLSPEGIAGVVLGVLAVVGGIAVALLPQLREALNLKF